MKKKKKKMKLPSEALAKQVLVDELMIRAKDGGSDELAFFKAEVEAFWSKEGAEYAKCVVFEDFESFIEKSSLKLVKALGLKEKPNVCFVTKL